MLSKYNAKKSKAASKFIETFTHDGASCKYIPTAEFESAMDKDHQTPVRVSYERRAGGHSEAVC